MIAGANSWDEVYLSDQEILSKRHAWVEKHHDLLLLAFDEFLSTGEWPEREAFRRKLTQQDVEINLDDFLDEMPKPEWIQTPVVPDRIRLSLQVLRELPEAKNILNFCVAIVQRAYELYRSDDQAKPQLRSDDPKLLDAASGDARLLVLAREILEQNWPDPLGSGTAGTESTEWTRDLHGVVMPGFKDIATIDDYIGAQENIVKQSRARLERRATPSQVIQPATASNLVAEADTNKLSIFVIMPFGESWSDGTYSHIRQSVEDLGVPGEVIRVYRADEISKQGSITSQIKNAISTANVVIADITEVNANVMWELGYADGLGKSIVILNQNPGDSPFDMVDRRQVRYSPEPNEDDRAELVRHLDEAVRSAFGDSPPSWLAGLE